MTFTIVIPCHDAERTLARTLRSVRAQTDTDWQILAVDDRSTDTTPYILHNFALAEPRLRILAGPGRGASAARNAGLAQAGDGPVAFLDADDIWAPTRLAAFRPVLDAGAGIAYSRYAFFGEEPGDTPTVSTVPPARPGVADLLRENPVGTMSNLVATRAALDRAGPFREDMTHGEDREWLVRAAARGLSLTGIDETLLHYRTSPGGLSTDLEKMHAGWRESARTAATHGALPPPRTMRAAEAVYLRYLARRALRLGLPPDVAASYALRGVRLSPRGFFSGGARGPLTLGSALAALIAPRMVRGALSNR